MSLHAIYLHQVSRGGAKKRRGGRRQLNKGESVEGLECKEFSQQELGEEVSTASAPGLGLSLTPGQEGGLSSSPFLAPSAAAAAGTVGRGLSLPAVPGLAQPPTEPLSR